MKPISRAGHWLHIYQDWLCKIKGPGRGLVLFLLGVLAATSQAPHYFLPGFITAFTSLVWLLDALARDPGTRSVLRRRAFLTGWSFAFGYLLHSLYWLAFSFAVHGQDAMMKALLWGVGFTGTALLCAFIAGFYGIALAMVIRWWPHGLASSWRFRDAAARLALFVIAWSLAEYARGHLLTGLPWNLVGQIVAGHLVSAQSVALLGPYGVGVIILWLAVLPANILLGTRLARPSLLIMAGLVMAGAGYGGWRLLGIPEPADTPAVSVRIVQPNIPQSDKIDPGKYAANFNRALALSVTPGAGTPGPDIGPPRPAARTDDYRPADGAADDLLGDLTANDRQDREDASRRVVIWPENASYDFFQSSPEARRLISQSFPDQTILLSGALRWVSEATGAGRSFYNTMLVMERPPAEAGRSREIGRTPPPIFEIKDSFDKHHLAPFGEYIPLSGMIETLGLGHLIPFDNSFEAGTGPRILEIADTRMAPIICYETIFPGRAYPKSGLFGAPGITERPDWLVTITNDAWFGDTAGPLQHLAQSRLRSIETGLPMMRAANTGISAVIDAKGRIISRLPLYQEGVLDTPLLGPVSPPPYTRLGDMLYWVILSGMGLSLLRYYRKNGDRMGPRSIKPGNEGGLVSR